MKLNIGCGGRPLSGYINIDQDSIAELQRRYPDRKFDAGVIVEDLNIFDLPYAAESIEEVNADAVLEHLSFKDEPRFLYEVFRVLKSGGTFNLTVPDFEATCRAWLEACDDWKGFFSDSDEDIKALHWFGTHSYNYENRWGYIMATFFGPQNGSGQFHRNAYSEKKLLAMMKFVGFVDISVERFRWQDDRDFMLRTVCHKQ